VNAALALAPDLELIPRDTRLELDALREMADWALRYTPSVSVESSNALLLDIQGSLRLFGGLDTLRAAISNDFVTRGHKVLAACAPTASAAIWLARAGRESVVRERAELPARLAALPLRCLNWPEKTRQTLSDMGVYTLSECIRLPRDGLARRIGPKRLRELDQGLGRQPEVRVLHVPSKRFHEVMELVTETADSDLLLESLRHLLALLRAFLLRHQGGVQILWIHLYHNDRPATLLRVGLLQPAGDPAYLEELIRMRFEKIYLPAAVIAIVLQADLVNLAASSGPDLLGRIPDDAHRILELLERLRVRLGFQAVHGMRAVAEHRPESAWQRVSEPGIDPAAPPQAAVPDRRPLWMLDAPLPLEMRAGQPVFEGVLNLDSGPERIETGWWDGRDIRRDYYIACNPLGMRFWVFRDLRESRWYLHGIFA
jgi:protein ImuB